MLSDSEIPNEASGDTFKTFLERRYKPATVRDYEGKRLMFYSWLQEEGLSEDQVEYKDLLRYIRYVKTRGNINKMLGVVRLYYKYLIENGRVTENPAAGLYVKGSTKRLPHDLAEREELEAMYHGYKTTTLKDKRDKVLLGLLIYQGLTLEELERLEASDIRLMEGKTEIRGSQTSNGRILMLEAAQVLSIGEYIKEVRPELLKKRKCQNETRQLFFGTEGDLKLGNTVKRIMRKIRRQHPEHAKLTARKIRESVIVHWLKTKDIRTVQYLAGHRYVSSTERYKKLDLEHLKEQVNELHPLKGF